MTAKPHALRLRDVVNLAAPHTWAASVLPSLLALAVSYGETGHIPADLAVCLFLAAVLMQSAVNALNDYADYVKGTDTAENSPEDYDAVIVYGLAPRTARNIGFAFLAAALIPGIYAVVRCGIFPLLVGLAGGAAVVFYSFGPSPLSYLPLGELVSGLVMGVGIPLAGVSMLTGRVNPLVLLLSLPVALGIAMIMFSNNACDIDRDTLAGRRTAACLLGRERTDRLYRAALIAWIALPAVILLLLGRFTSLLTYALVLPVLLPSFLIHFRRPLSPEGRPAVMAGINSLNLLLGFAWCVAVLVK